MVLVYRQSYLILLGLIFLTDLCFIVATAFLVVGTYYASNGVLQKKSNNNYALCMDGQPSRTNTEKVMRFYSMRNTKFGIRSTTTVGSDSDYSDEKILSFDDLMEMDIVTFVRRKSNNNNKNNNNKNNTDIEQNNDAVVELGTICNGALVPLCAWTTESAYAASSSMKHPIIEFLHNDDQGVLQKDEVILHSLVPAISYGSRQLGGGKGPGNPHGEESELLYYVDKDTLDKLGVHIVVRPELEILW
jgi:hypothetical protein